jgi:tRNA G18 (ribose-2'-O)-methylase SpoU
MPANEALKWTMEELNRLSPEEFKTKVKPPLVVILDNVRSLHNVGSIFRTSDAFQVEKLYLCGFTGQPPHREINKTALGATDSVTWEHMETTEMCIRKLKSEGWKVYAIEQVKGSIFLDNMSFSTEDKIAFVFGNEVFGVSEEVLHLCDGYIEIPQFGTKHSFNITITVGIVLWHYFISKK